MRIERPFVFPLALAAALAGAPAGAVADTSFPVLDVRDFNGDGESDLIAFCAAGPPLCADDSHEVWFLSGSTVLGKSAILPPLAADERVVGAGDFDGDGDADLIVADRFNDFAIWPMRGTTRHRAAIPLRPPGLTGWEIAATADFDGRDGPDILWRHSTTGRLAVAFIKNCVTVSKLIPRLDAALVRAGALVAAQDFGNGQLRNDGRVPGYDGHVDFLWLHPQRGAILWYLDGQLRLIAERTLERSKPDLPGDWQIASAGDYAPLPPSHPHRPGVVWWQEFTPPPAGGMSPSEVMGGSGSIIIYELDPEGVGIATEPSADGPALPPGWQLVGPR